MSQNFLFRDGSGRVFSSGQDVDHASVETTQAVTDQELVAAPGAGFAIEVDELHVSADVKQTVTLESGNSTLKWRVYIAQDQTEDHTSGTGFGLFRCAANEALTLTTSGAGNTFVSVTYRTVKV